MTTIGNVTKDAVADVAIRRERRPASPLISWILNRGLPALTFCILLVAAWQFMSVRLASPLVPDVAEIGREIARIVADGMAAKQIGITLWRILAGFSLAFAVAITLGIVAARSTIFRSFLEPAIVLGLTVPGLVWALLCVIWFGVSLWTAVVSIALGITPALVLSVVQGVQSVDAQVIEMAHVFRFSRYAKLRHVWIPSLVPFLFSGARLGFSLAWKVIVLVELFGLSNGVGYQLNSEFSSQNVGGVIAWTIVFWVVMSVIEYGFLQTLERRSRAWQRTATV